MQLPPADFPGLVQGYNGVVGGGGRHETPTKCSSCKSTLYRRSGSEGIPVNRFRDFGCSKHDMMTCPLSWPLTRTCRGTLAHSKKWKSLL